MQDVDVKKDIAQGLEIVDVKVGDAAAIGDATPMTLSWRDVEYSVPVKNGTKIIINGCTGLARPGQILCIMGPSGAGKSSLLDLLAGRNKATVGDVLLNGNPIKAQMISYLASYVEQDDALYPSLSVRESILYSARLRLPRALSREAVEKRVDDVIDEMGLRRVANTKIGNTIFRGVSGGERRRVSIASQLVTAPQLMFLDEPTSGLDSEASFQVMSTLKRLASAGKTIIATIHQPSSEVYSLFDNLLLLARGKTVFLGKASDALKHFERQSLPCPDHFNPPDHFLSVTNTDFQGDGGSRAANVERLVKSFPESEYGQLILNDVDQKGQHVELPNLGYAQSMLVETSILTERSFKNAGRNILLYWIRAAMYIAMAILMGTCWWDVGLDQSQVQDRFSVHFFAVAFLCFMSVASIPALIEEKSVYNRERANGSYRAISYVISNTLVSLPFIMFIAILFTIVAYPMIKLQSGADKIINFTFMLFLSLYTMESIVIVISAALPIFVVSLAIVSFLNGLFMCVQGYFVRLQSLPDAWRYTAHYWSYQTYAFEALVRNDFEGLTFNCARILGGATNACNCAYIAADTTNSCTFTGMDVLRDFGYDDVSYNNWVWVLVGQIVAYRIIMFLVLHYKIGIKVR